MHPIICRIGPFTVFSYGLMLAAAFIVSVSLAARYAKKRSMDPAVVFNFSFIVFMSGIAGARLFYVVEHLPYYIERPLEIIMLPSGGLAWFGGLIFGSISGIVYLKIKKIRIYTFLDVMVPFVALGQAIGRVGCLLNGCCYGKPSPLGIYFPVHQQVLLPTQAYSSLVLLLIFIVLRLTQKREMKEGIVFYLYLVLYSTARFFIEFWRADNPVILGGLTLFQVLSALVLFFGITQLIRIRTCRPYQST